MAGRGDVWRLVQLMADAHARLLSSLTLVIDAGVRSRALAPLVGAKFWQLRALRAGYHARGNRVVRALVEQPQLHLRTLDLRHAGLTDEGMLALAGCEQLRGLRSLVLSSTIASRRAAPRRSCNARRWPVSRSSISGTIRWGGRGRGAGRIAAPRRAHGALSVRR